jgi:siroheme synthase
MRGNDALSAADVVVYDRLVNPALIEGKEAVFAGKEPGCHHIRQDEINALLISLAAEGKNVVRLKGGDPFVFGRGGEEAEAWPKPTLTSRSSPHHLGSRRTCLCGNPSDR